MNFKPCDIRLPSKVYWGAGSIKALQDIVSYTRATHIALFTDAVLRAAGTVDGVIDVLTGTGLPLLIRDNLATEPSYPEFRALCEDLLSQDIDIIIAVGGGSVMDQAKLAAAAMRNPAFLDNIKDTTLLVQQPVPMVAVPTTAGTGAEASANAILFFPEEELKVGIVHEKLLPPFVVLDPVLTSKMPPSLTASTGVDALCHALESLISKKSNGMCELYARESLRLIARYLKRAYDNGADEEARCGMLLAAFYAGVCLATSSTVAVHALSYPLGGKYHIPHGVANAILLPFVMEYNLPACREMFALVADDIGLPGDDRAQALVEWLYSLTEDLAIPRDLTRYGIRKEEAPALAQQALKVQRLLSQNPREMSAEDIEAVYERLL